MSPSIVSSLIFLLLSLMLLRRCAAADGNTTYYLGYKNCSNSGDSTSSSSVLYKTNLRQLLTTLPSNAINNSGFYNGTVGSTNTVFGMAMCYADIPWPDQCVGCLQAASAGAPEACPSSSNASVAYRGCVLRYSDAPMDALDRRDVDRGFAFYTQDRAAAVPDTTAFGQTRNELFKVLASAAAISPLKIASGNLTFNSTHTLYGLAQCNRDLPRDLCSYMISAVANMIGPKLKMADVQWSEALSITGLSFYIRYDLKPFQVYIPATATGTGIGTGAANGTGPSDTRKDTSIDRREIIGIAVSISTIVMLVAFMVMRHYQRKWKVAKIRECTRLKEFSYAEIKSGTKNFATDTKIGEGGFGQVYKGMFKFERDLKVLAVKCVTRQAAAKQLLDELKMLARLEHKNVVQLIGFCSDNSWFRFGRLGSGLYVCSEFFGHGSLDTHIFDLADQEREPLRWPIRYRIIRGICAGLQYLHEDCNSTIAHMDLKPSNILLDQYMMPKIADFGLSRAMEKAKTHTYTTTTIGSNGYIAPEFMERGKVGRKCDIYSLGVLIMGIVRGEGPKGILDPCGVRFINKTREMFNIDEASAPMKISSKNREQLKKDASADDACIEDVEKCIGLAFECIAEDPKDRPPATDICRRLDISIDVSYVQV